MASIATFSIDDVYKQYKGGLRDIHRAASVLRAQSPVPFGVLTETMQRLKQQAAYCDGRLSRFPDDIVAYAQAQEAAKGYDVVAEWQATRAAIDASLDAMAALAAAGSTFTVDEAAKTVTEPRYQKAAAAALETALDGVIASITAP